MTNEELARAYRITGIWIPGMKCDCDVFSDPDADADNLGRRWCDECGSLATKRLGFPVVPHDVAMPPLTDKLAMQMLAWLLRDGRHVTFCPNAADGGPTVERVRTAIAITAAKLAEQEGIR